ncbi:class I SAM-dependent methyltransferase [Brevundimonas sp. BAL450]|jgi:trans-aconitate methyltransferase|uniref:Methyltransferase type 12 domain-containing protein n=1 Tax=Brevundimonas abyssalis TAR-001 TaxID=1391729 RepID=A0A8E0NB40_9CAUL|nr:MULTISPECIES: class I SAM-dependent methyltransferase [Brevundimonas]MBG7616681.1 class I SAM-dependent methyltransferase [Brevundimonas sp. BAL450]GAD58512.1 hypothetical protein MBEBAB_0762 [Brevundimonas abyssalis TAR-001]
MTGHDGDRWNDVYRSKTSDQVSWFEATPTASLEALRRVGAGPRRSLIDVGGGASALVDRLLDLGWSDLTVLDIAEEALEVSKARLGARADRVDWRVADIVTWRAKRRYDLWHDRAVFHFLITVEARAAYRRALAAGLAPDGHVIIATFAPEGPDRCSGLPVRRYDVAGLHREFEVDFDLVDHWTDYHRTPAGGFQAFTWATLRKRP